MKKLLCTTVAAVALRSVCLGQNLPQEWQLQDDTHRLIIGGVMDDGIFNDGTIKTLRLTFASSNWFNQLTQNFTSGTEIPATLIFEEDTLLQVGVTFKGQTSYQQTAGEEKKSFNIRTDAFVANQTLHGFDVLNLNNCFDDPTFLREFLYLKSIRNHIPAAQARFVELVINGVSWGLYPMVEQLDGHFIGEWYLSNDGSRWRADAPTTTGGGPGGGGPQWGDGTAALNYLGATAELYQQYYTLKGSDQPDPWGDLVEVCDVLNTTDAAELTTALPQVLDIDRTLWYLACENVFADDDSYIMKGKMDYYIYIDPETGRLTPLEFDGNSVLDQGALGWGPFYHADNVNYPLLHVLLNVAEYRQRYLAHMRTLLSETVDPMLANQTIASWANFIDAHVLADTKKLYTYAQFTSGASSLHTYLQTRRNNLMNNAEVNQTGAVITDVTMHSQSGEWTDPVSGDAVTVSAAVTSPDGLQRVILYYSASLVGNFTAVDMIESSGGEYTATIPGQTAGTMVRFYIEARENNAAHTASFEPKGAEHDVYYYTVISAYAPSTDVVINEILASNATGESDSFGEFDDWIELYNRGTAAIDLTGYYLTDNDFNLTKWALPEGTVLAPDAYLIVWADEDSAQGPLHANFKLAATGEGLMLINAEGQIADYIDFGTQTTDIAFARRPNGFGDFQQQDETFSFSNDLVDVQESTEHSFGIYPNPANEWLMIRNGNPNAGLEIYDAMGRCVLTSSGYTQMLNVSSLPAGTYFVRELNAQAAAQVFLKQ